LWLSFLSLRAIRGVDDYFNSLRFVALSNFGESRRRFNACVRGKQSMLAKRIRILIFCVAATSTSLFGCGNNSDSTAEEGHDSTSVVTTGPANGSLVVAGGNVQDPAIIGRFLELAGGVDASIVVVPTAAGGNIDDLPWNILEPLQKVGATNLTVLHTRDPKEADTDEFAAPLKDAAGVWFVGGRQWRIADSYLGTKTQEEFRAVLERGGVIGGSSAGATIQGSYLARGDSNANTIMMGDHEQGFSYIENVAIDQHLLVRNRQFDLQEIMDARPELLGLGLDEDTAIVVTGDDFEVIGQGYVAVYDSARTVGRDGHFYFLMPGDQFNLRSRTPQRPGDDSDSFAILGTKE
jgi:cyanophycinase